MKLKILHLTIFFLFQTVFTKTLDSIELDLNGGFLTSKPPFDKKFLLKGPANSNLFKVIATLKYQDTQDTIHTGSWILRGAPISNGKFSVLIPELKPNKKYEITLTLTSLLPSTSDSTIGAIKKAIYSEYSNNSDDSTPNNSDLDSTLKSIITRELKLNPELHILGFDDSTLSNFQEKFSNESKELGDKLKNIQFTLDPLPSLTSENLDTSHAKDTDAFIKEYKENVDAAYNREQNNIASLDSIKTDSSNIDEISENLKKTEDVLNNSKNTFIEIHKWLENSKSKFKDDFYSIVDSSIKVNIDSIQDRVKSISECEKNIAIQKTLVKSLINYPNLKTETTINIKTDTDIPIQNGDNDNEFYRSLDIGFALIPDFDDIYAYAGFNIYFRPVNKGGKFYPLLGNLDPGDSWFCDALLSRASFLVATPMFKDNTITGVRNFAFGKTLLLGVGLRLTRYLKTNTGVALFKAAHDNERLLFNKYKLGYSWFWAVSLDYDIFGVFDKVTNKLPSFLDFEKGGISR